VGRWCWLFSRRKHMMEALDQEIGDFIERETQDNIERGMAPEEARYAALRKFGNVTRFKEDTREVWSFVWLEQLWQDVRYGLRTLRKSPGFTTVAVLTLALGIGANTAMFSVVEGIMLAPLPFRQPDRLVMIWEWNQHLKEIKEPSYPNFLDWQRTAGSFEEMAGYKWHSYGLTSPGAPAHVPIMEVSSSFFRMLGTKPALGREFTPQEDKHGGAPVAMISDRFWRERFGSNPEALGKAITLNEVDYTIVGVLPPGFSLFGNRYETEVYTPLGQGDPLMLNPRGGYGCVVTARLKAGVCIHQAAAEMSTIQSRLDRLYPDADEGMGTEVEPFRQRFIGDEVRGALFLLLGAVGVVLLIACANVANLLLARASGRVREFAIRASLGATRIRVVRQLLTESILLSLAGGGLGLLIAPWGVKAVLAASPSDLPWVRGIGLNVPVLLFALGATFVVGILFGLAPALTSTKSALEDSLKEGGRTSAGGNHRTQGGLVVLQMGLTLILLVCTGLLFRTIRHLWKVDPGFDMPDLITFRVDFPPSLRRSPAIMRSAYQQMLERIRAIPGVEAADFIYNIPLSGWENNAYFWIGTQKPAVIQAAPQMLVFDTGPDYLRTMRIPLLRGRFFTPADNNSSPCVAAIDSVMADTYFPHQDPLGRMLTFGWTPPMGPCRIVGVVGHVKHWGLGSESGYVRAESYYPLYQLPDPWVTASEGYRNTTIVVRTSLSLAAVMPAIKTAVFAGGKEQPLYDVQTMQEIASQSMSPQRFPMILFGAFAGLALLLASIGIYGVISYSVARRVREMGIRMALGAERQDIFRMVIGQGLRLGLAGIAIGVAGWLILARALPSMSHLLCGVGAIDPLTFAAVSLLLLAVSLLAVYIPARRATKVDPMVALRYE